MATKRRTRRTRSRANRWLAPVRAVTPALALVLSLVALVASQQGWVSVDPATSQVAYVGTDVLNVRAGPAMEANVVTTAGQGDRVEVIGAAENGFYPVRIDGARGWMSAQYLVFDHEPLPTQPMSGYQPAVAHAAEIPSRDIPEESAEQSRLPEREPEAVATEEVASQPAPPTGERWIEIDRSNATVTLHHGDHVIAVYTGRIGQDPSADGFYSTAIGTFYVYSMNKGLAPTPFAEDTYLTDWVGFDPVRSNGIHSPVRDSNGVEKEWQNQTTLGCVRLAAPAAVAVFEFAEIGMRVVVRE